MLSPEAAVVVDLMLVGGRPLYINDSICPVHRKTYQKNISQLVLGMKESVSHVSELAPSASRGHPGGRGRCAS